MKTRRAKAALNLSSHFEDTFQNDYVPKTLLGFYRNFLPGLKLVSPLPVSGSLVLMLNLSRLSSDNCKKRCLFFHAT